jgi:hypothetical protein
MKRNPVGLALAPRRNPPLVSKNSVLTFAVAAALEKPTLQSLRSFQHNDKNGNPIGMSRLLLGASSSI